MAGNQNSGGMRPTAPQNNPANISLTGGNGQSGNNGQAARYIPGMPYGQGQATMQQQQSATMSKPMPAAMNQSRVLNTRTQNVLPITEETARPEEDVMAGLTPYGQPNDPSQLGLPSQMPDADPDIEMVRRFLPAMEFWASQPGSSQATKDYVVYLRGAV
jgi:hypothetical protein